MDGPDKAFARVRRQNFVLPEYESNADFDAPLPIGFGQTISQPYTVRLMLEWLEVQLGDKVLDVGSGSGWTTALLSHLVGRTGKVYAVELIAELVEFGRDNCRRMGIQNARFYQAGKQYGLPRFAPYDRILVSASADMLPSSLVDQLKIGGKLVIPIRNDIIEIEKIAQDELDTRVHPGFVFVPLLPG